MKLLTIDNYHELQPYIAQADYHEYNSNAMTLLMWSNFYVTYFEAEKHFALINICMPDDTRIWLMPQCEEKYRKEAIEAMRLISEREKIPFCIHSMTKSFKDWLMKQYPHEFLIWDCYDARDYIYDRKRQETLSGKKMQKRRNHYNAFIKQYENRFLYKPLEKEDIVHIYTFLQKWKALKKESEIKTIEAEEIGIHMLLDHFEQLPVMGGCIYIDGKLEAFTIASRLSKDMVQIHVEKANKNIRGLYIAILKHFLMTLEDDIQWINREDDMGLPELRKAKNDMQPIQKIQKFGSCHQMTQIQKASSQWCSKIKELWLSRFQEETIPSTAFYFDHLYQEEDTYILNSKDQLIAMLQLRKMDLMIDGMKQQVPFVFGVATAEEYEGCGYMRLLLQHVLDELYETYPYVILQAYDWNLYRSFGFEEVYKHARYKLNTSAYDASPKIASCEDASILLDLYEQFTANLNGYRIRDLAYYKEQFLPYAKIWHQKILLYQYEKPMGYMCIEENAEEIHVLECVYRNEEALINMLGYFHEETRKVYIDLPVDVQIEGRRKEVTCMMVKENHGSIFPREHLYINEEV